MRPFSATTLWILGLVGVGSFGALELYGEKIGVRGKKILFLLATVSLWVFGAALFVLLPTDLAWIAIALLWIRAAYTAFLRTESTQGADNEHTYRVVKIVLIVVLVLLAGGHGLSFLLKQSRDWPYRKILSRVEQIQRKSSFRADLAGGGGFIRNKILLVYNSPSPLSCMPRFFVPAAARIANACTFLPSYSVSRHQEELADELRATRVEEVGTVVVLSEFSSYSEHYYAVAPYRSSTPDPNVKGQSRTLSVTLIDLASSRVLGWRSFDSASPERITVVSGTKSNIGADDPYPELSVYLSRLPRR